MNVAATVERQRLRPISIAALAVGLTVGYLAGDLLPEVVDALRNDLGMSASLAGALATTLLFATAAAGLVFARRAGRPGRPRFAVTGACVAIIGFIVAAFANGLLVLVAGCLTAGFGSGIVLAFATAAISATVDPERASGLAIVVNTAVGAVLLFVLPRITGAEARATFLAMAVIGMLALPLFRWLPDAPTLDGEDTSGRPSALPSIGLGALIFVGALLLDMTDNGMWAFVGTLVMDQVGLTSNELGTVLSMAAFAGLAGACLPIVVGARWGLFAPIMAMVVVDAAAKVLVLVAATPTAYAICQFLWTASYAALFAYLLAVGAKLDSRGRWAAIVGSAFAMGDAVGPVVFGFAADTGGVGSLAVMMIVSSVAVALLLGPPVLRLDRKGPDAGSGLSAPRAGQVDP